MVAIHSGVPGLDVLQLVVLEFAYRAVLAQIRLRLLMEKTALTWEITIRRRNATVERSVHIWERQKIAAARRTAVFSKITLRKQNVTIQAARVKTFECFVLSLNIRLISLLAD